MFQSLTDWLIRIGPRLQRAFIEGDRWKLYLQGLGTTLELTVIALIFGVLLGLVVAVIRSAHDQQRLGRKRNPPLEILNVLCQIYTTVIRGTPMLVQLFIWTFVIFPAQRNKVLVAFIGLGVNSGAYVAEIIRGGLMSVDPGQSEAAWGVLTPCVSLSSPRRLRTSCRPLATSSLRCSRTPRWRRPSAARRCCTMPAPSAAEPSTICRR